LRANTEVRLLMCIKASSWFICKNGYYFALYSYWVLWFYYPYRSKNGLVSSTYQQAWKLIKVQVVSQSTVMPIFKHFFVFSSFQSLLRWLDSNPQPWDDEASFQPLCYYRWPTYSVYRLGEVLSLGYLILCILKILTQISSFKTWFVVPILTLKN